MKRSKRLLLLLALVAVFAITWVVVLTAKSSDQLQAELIGQAAEYMEDGVYVLAAPLLEEAAGYNASRTVEAENMLKESYLNMMGQSGVRRKYIALLEKQMNRSGAGPDVFLEAANFYLDGGRFIDAYGVLTDGIAKTQSEDLVTLYEKNRYEYKAGYTYYDDVTLTFGATIGVCRDGLWGLASSGGDLIIPCEYNKISTFNNGRAIVKKGGEIYAVDRFGNRLALQKEGAADFGNYASDRVPLLIDGKWYRATGGFQRGEMAFENIGMYSGGYAPAQYNGKWGLVDTSIYWMLPAEYDGIVTDELGRAYAQGAVFVKQGASVSLIVNGADTGLTYDDARPFGSEGYAAVRKNGKWGFIDTAGQVKIDYQFDDALSFGQHLAAVKQGDLWGYVSLYGEIAIEPVFLQAKSFAGGSAPVKTEQGWRFITLLEYRSEDGLM